MTFKDILRMRLVAQRLAGEGKAVSPAEVVAGFGAMQSQDYGMSKWAVGLRIGGSHEEVEEAIERGEILRTHVLRPTWHLVAAADIRWMLELTAPQIRTKMAFREKYLELDKKILARCRRLVGAALAKKPQMPRTELVALFKKAGIATDDNRSSHILVDAELEGLICSGPGKGTYALLDERAPSARRLSREEALAELTRRYFSGHGPATLNDFSWWSGLLVKDVKKGVASLGAELRSVKLKEKEYWLVDGKEGARMPSALLLPAFDEWIIGYADRAGLFATEHERKIITVNGLFRPVMVCNGLATGSWRPVEKRERL
ncbi:winged helix DNA-binding domain-containing protein [Puia sp. P3]|uniref:winged helix DNA-binding domain-containing protein n=1 Tax=Puia sp. P3 TaxID=3423952 RepID=UPI003D67654A